MSAATTSNWTMVARSQQQEGASVALQGTPSTVVMLRETTGDASMLPTPIAAAAQVAKVVAETLAASTPHNWTSACTNSQAYDELGAGAGATTGAAAGAEVIRVAAGVAAKVAAGVEAKVAAGVAVATGVVASGVAAGVAAGVARDGDA